MSDADAIPLIAQFLHHTDEQLRMRALAALVFRGNMAAVPYLTAAAQRAAMEPSRSMEAALLRDAAKTLAKGTIDDPNLKPPQGEQPRWATAQGEKSS